MPLSWVSQTKCKSKWVPPYFLWGGGSWPIPIVSLCTHYTIYGHSFLIFLQTSVLPVVFKCMFLYIRLSHCCALPSRLCVYYVNEPRCTQQHWQRKSYCGYVLWCYGQKKWKKVFFFPTWKLPKLETVSFLQHSFIRQQSKLLSIVVIFLIS